MSLGTARFRDEGLFVAMANRISLPAWGGFLPATWLEGLALHESAGGNPQARHWDSQRDPNGHDDGAFEIWASFGLFQVEGSTALTLLNIPKDVWGRVDLTFLYKPLTCGAFAAQLIYQDLVTFSDAERAIAAYNGGTWGATGDIGRLNDQAYVELIREKSRLVALDKKEVV